MLKNTEDKTNKGRKLISSLKLKKEGFCDSIRLMILIWRMWRIVIKLYRLQQIYIDTRRNGITDIDKRNMAVFSKTEWYVPKDNLYIKNPDRSVIMGSAEYFRQQKREFDPTIFTAIPVFVLEYFP